MTNLAIDQTTGDLIESAGQIQQVEDLDAVNQSVYSDLRTFLGEYWLDPDVGVPYIQTIFQKGVDLSIINSVIKDKILSNADVSEITEFTSDFDARERRFSFTFSALTTYGMIEDMEVSL